MTLTTTKLFLSILFGALWLSSCTIEKRSYMPGWHVEWKGKKGHNSSEDRTDALPFKEAPSAEAETLPETNCHADIPPSEIPLLITEPSEQVFPGTPFIIVADESMDQSAAAENNNPENKRTHPAAIASTVASSISAVCFAILFFMLLFFLFGAVFSDALVAALFVLGILMAIIAIITGGVGLNQIRRYPDQFKGEGLAIYGLASGLSVLLLVLFVYIKIMIIF